ncbi:MAG: hypothetical protein N2662_03335 [Bacteroidales bacterium]|nr:hypothetical protein [Bacteroidales bacterium]
MYFLTKKRYVLAIFLFLSLLQTQQLFARYVPGTPIIQTFPFPESFPASDTISVFEDPQGYFLIGAKEQLILFYGNEFVGLPLKGQIFLNANQHSVFYSCYNQIGIVKFYKNSLPQLIPLIVKDNSSTDFGQIFNVLLQNNNLYFNNFRKLFSTTDGNIIKTVDSSKYFIQIFRTGDTLLIFKPEIGLYKLINGKSSPINTKNIPSHSKIQFVIPYKNGWLIKFCATKEFIFLHDEKAQAIKLGFESILNKTIINDLILLPDNTFAIASASSGVFLYDSNSGDIRRIGVSEGLLDNTVLKLHLDQGNNLWTLHPQGLSCIQSQYNVSMLGRESGLRGTVTDMVKFNHKLWVATTDGLFIEQQPSQNITNPISKLIFREVNEITHKCIKLIVANKVLLVFTPTGFFRLNSEGKITNFVLTEIRDVATNDANNQLYIASRNGIFVGQITPSGNINFTDSLLYGTAINQLEWKDNQLWFVQNNMQVGSIIAKAGKIEISCKILYPNTSQIESKPLYLLSSTGGIRVCMGYQIFQYEEKNNTLVLQPKALPVTLEEIPFAVELFSDNRNKWYRVASKFEDHKGILVLHKNIGSNTGSYFFRTGTIFSPMLIDSPYVWIGGKDKLYCYDASFEFTAKRNFVTIIKRAVIGKDSVLRIQLVDPEINYRYRNIKFEVSSTRFESQPFVRYQYRLIGQSEDWSDWTQQTTFTFNNLSPGYFSFQVRALDLDGTISDITELSFYILPPFYRTLPAYILYFLFFLLAIFVLLKYRTWRFIKKKEELDELVQKRTAEILREKEKSEQLIANLLPKTTADELKQTGKASTQKFSMVTVLFSDIQGFTKIAEQMNPEALIDQLDSFFFHFDSVIEKYNIEKIKTIGDAYMCAGGLPNKNSTNPVEVVLAALEMVHYMENLKANNANIWDLRIGIHTGSVIAGVVGHKKLSYDIWGDTVNTASRMESSGEPGKINISGQTYEFVKDFFICEYRGKMPVKYKGEIDMYFVKGIQPDLAAENPYVPNEKFFLKLQLLRLQDLEENVFNLLNQNLPPNIYFHSTKWQEETYHLVELYSRAEQISIEETLLVRTAALLMNIGYIWSYDEHESESIRYARETLPQYRYSETQVEAIVNLIDVTRGMRKPINKMEEILLDAEMSYLGRADFETLNELYFREMYEHQKVNSWEEWAKMQMVILSNHRYYTHVANVLRDVSPEKQIELLLRNIHNSS